MREASVKVRRSRVPEIVVSPMKGSNDAFIKPSPM